MSYFGRLLKFEIIFSELLSGMKIDRTKPKQDVSPLESRADQVRTMLIKSKRVIEKSPRAPSSVQV